MGALHAACLKSAADGPRAGRHTDFSGARRRLQKWAKMAGKWPKLGPKMDENGRKWAKKWATMAKNGRKWPKMTKNERKWPENGRK